MPRFLVVVIAIALAGGVAFLALRDSTESPAPAQKAAPATAQAPAPAALKPAEPVVAEKPAEPAAATPAAAAGAVLDNAGMLAERSIGKADAPLTIHEFASLNCPHCATFHRDTFPKIKAAYIDTGKVRLVMNDFPLDDIALVGHMLARCVPAERYFGMISAIFSTQPQWRKSETPREDLMKIAQLAGMSEADAIACVDNDALRTGIEAAAALAHDKHGIKSTPSFLIDGTRVPGALPFEDFQDIIDKALARKTGGR